MTSQQTDRTLTTPRAALLRDQRGLSTMEYTVLFVVILIGSLTIWHKLGKGMGTQLQQGTEGVQNTLGGHQTGNGTESQGTGNSGKPPSGTTDPASGSTQPVHANPGNSESAPGKRALTH